MRWLICYDIRDRRQLVRVQRRVSRDAIALQQSVYRLDCTWHDLDLLCDALRAYIDPAVDDVRLYPIAPDGPDWSIEPKGLHGVTVVPT